MEKQSGAALLRIFVSSTDKYEHQLLHEYIVFKAKERGLAGATVLKGMLGFGASSVIHSYKFWEMGEKVPVVIELVDEESKVRAFGDFLLPLLESLRYGCLVTMQPVEVLLYKTGGKHRET
jgi:PII-like signaling protein